LSTILLLYHREPVPNAATIMEHAMSFSQYSKFPVYSINTVYGFPGCLKGLEFDIIVLHYSVLGFSLDKETPLLLDDRFIEYLHKSKAYKIAIPQDEFHFCQQRFCFFNQLQLDCVYTLYEPKYWKNTYGKYTRIPKVLYTIPGFVSDNLIHKARVYAKKSDRRTIDIGYRGREITLCAGEAGWEKQWIALGLKARPNSLVMDIETSEKERLYGNNWYKFLGDCKAILGTESGSSITDIDGSLQRKPNSIQAYISAKPILTPYENNIPYRMISPRVFEAAAFRCAQILFEGYYSGIISPDVHFLPLKKDFSNFDSVMELLQEKAFVKSITLHAYEDLIESGKYHYKTFIALFDSHLVSEGFSPNNNFSIATSGKLNFSLQSMALWKQIADVKWYYNKPRRLLPNNVLKKWKYQLLKSLSILKKLVSIIRIAFILATFITCGAGHFV